MDTDLAQTLTDPAHLFAAALAIVALVSFVMLVAPMFQPSGLDTRLKSVANRREELRRRSREALTKTNQGKASLRQTDESIYKRVVERLQLRRLLEDPKVAEKLSQAGLRGPRPISTYYFFRFAGPLIVLPVTAIYIFLINGFGLQLMGKFCVCVMAMAVGFYAPSLYVSNVATKRRVSIGYAFPDALDLMLICVESGMTIEVALQKVSEEIGSSSIALAEELTLLNAELSYLPERRAAYEGLAKRTNHPGVKAVTMAMIQSERYGTPLGSALRVMSKEQRDLRLSAAEKKASALPAQLTVPMILFFLPVLFAVILGPTIIRVQDTFAHNPVNK